MFSNVFGNNEKPVYDQDLVGFVEKEYLRRQRERRFFELIWRLNLAFYEGNQFMDINTATWQLEEQPLMFDWQEREVFNHIAPNIDTRISKLKKMRVVPKVNPAGINDVADLNSAKVATHILKTNYEKQKIKDKQAEEILWMEICGTVFRKHIWNRSKGRVIAQTEELQGENFEMETTQSQEVQEGDMEIVVIPPQEIFPDSCYHTSLDQCKSIIHAKAFSVDDIRDIWGVEVAPEVAETQKMVKAMTGLSGLSYGQGGFMLHTVKLENHAIVKEYWEKSGKEYTQGRFIIVAGGKLIHAGELPYFIDDDNQPGLPFTKLDCIARPGTFWGKTVLERLIPIQRRYNSLKNRKMEYLNRVSIGQWIVARDSVDLDLMQNEGGMPGTIIEYEPGLGPPSKIKDPPLPSTFENEEMNLLNEFTILSGVSEISRQSNVPPGVTSGVAMARMKEEDDSRISNTAENMERFEVESAKKQLRMFKQFVDLPRTLQITGKNNLAEVIDWTGNDLTSENVYIDSISALTDSPAQKRQMVFDLMSAGLLIDPDTGQINREMRSKIFEMIEMGDWETADDEYQLHSAKAERENRILKNGQQANLLEYDDHLVHINRHNKFRLTVDYEELRIQNPQIEDVFNEHVNQHLMFMAQGQAQAQAQNRQEQATQEPQI